jgi:hypothetical protein
MLKFVGGSSSGPYSGKRFTQPDLYGYRDKLFTSGFQLDTKILDNLPIAVQRELMAQISVRARQARDIIRKEAPKKSGALAASVYATGPVTKDVLKQVQEGGSTPPLHEQLRHSRGYLMAIQTANRRNPSKVPVTKGQNIGRFLFERTQREQGGAGRNLEGLMQLAGVSSKYNTFIHGSETLTNVSNLAPFTGMGKAARGSFYIGIGAAAYYAGWVNFGTSRQKATMFFSNEAERFVADTEKIISGVLDGMGE